MLEDDPSLISNPSHPNNFMSHHAPFLHRNMLSYGREASFELIVKSKSKAKQPLRISGGTRSSLISIRHDTGAGGTITTTTHSIDDFPIFLSIEDPGLVNFQGDTFVSVSLRINKDISLPLVSGYIYEMKPLTYPSNTMQDMIPNRGEFGMVQSSDPGAGEQISITLAANEIWRMLWANITFVTSSQVGNRTIQINFKDDQGGQLTCSSPQSQAESLSRSYSLAQFGDPRTSGVDNDIAINLPDNTWLTPSTVISTAVENETSSDNFGILFIMREKFYTGT